MTFFLGWLVIAMVGAFVFVFLPEILTRPRK